MMTLAARHRWRFRLTLAFGIAGKGAGQAEKLDEEIVGGSHNVSIMTCQTSDKLHMGVCSSRPQRPGGVADKEDEKKKQ